ncbi:glycosyltransferase, partial [Helicobacter aurati]|uniref:glycosyltransferase n=1 Tax=Helicobacter aurati TaxID=137778 RepID=UPI0013156969
FVGCYHECIMPSKDGHILYDNLDTDKESSGLALQKREVFMSLRTLCHRNVIDYSNPLIAHYLQRIFNGDVFINALLGGYGKVKYLSNILPSYYRLHAGGVYSSLADEDRIANSVRSLYYISSYYAQSNEYNLASLWLQESIMTFIRQQPIVLTQVDCERLIKSLWLQYQCTLPFKLAFRMVFPSLHRKIFACRDWLRKYRASFSITADVEKIYYKAFYEKRIPKTLRNFFARKIQRFQNKRFTKYRLQALQKNIDTFLRAGVLGVQPPQHKGEKPQLIVSLTSYPQRIYQVYYTVYSLLTQTYKPDKIILWLSSDEFPNRLQDLPHSLVCLRRFGLEIVWCSGNLKPYKKIIHALEAYKDCAIVIADDDALYPRDWLEKLVFAYRENPRSIHCHLASRLSLDSHGSLIPYTQWSSVIHTDSLQDSTSFLYLANGLGGVLYPPNSLYQDVLDSNLFTRLCPLGDDIWLWAMALLQGTKIHVVANNYHQFFITDWATQDTALWRVNCDEGYNDVQLNNILTYYPQLLQILQQAAQELLSNNISAITDTGGGGNTANL